MSIETVFGSAGHDHITGAQLARMIEGTVGKGDYVLRTQNELAATMQTANTVRIDTGDLVHDGRLATCERYTDLTVDSGVSGMKRNDLVVARFSKSSDQHQLVVVKGSPTAGEPTDPAVNDGAAGIAATADMPLWRVKLDGISPTLERVFEFAPTSTELRDSVSRAYSREEQETERLWLDGKRIYERTVDYGEMTAGETRKSLGFAYDTMVDYVFRSASLVLPAYPNDEYWRVDATVNSSEVVFRVGASIGWANPVGTFRYTK